MFRRAALWLFSLTLAATLVAPAPAQAQDAVLSADLSYVGPGPGGYDIYRYDYTLTNNNVEPLVIELLVFFDSDPAGDGTFSGDNSDYNNFGGFAGSVTAPAGWIIDVFEDADPNPWVVDWFDPSASNSIPPGGTLDGFSVTFLWKGTGVPPAQFFEAINGFAHEGTSVIASTNFPPITGTITAECSGKALLGVWVNLVDGMTGEILANTQTGPGGMYSFGELAPADYEISVSPPFGYYDADDKMVVFGEPTDFALECKPTQPPCPDDGSGKSGKSGCVTRGQKYWKNQIAIAKKNDDDSSNSGSSGRKGIVPVSTIIGLVDAVQTHFTENALHPVDIYNVPVTGTNLEKLCEADRILKAKSGVDKDDRKARAELLAAMLNVADMRKNPADIASEDGATVSQLITYAYDLITSFVSLPIGFEWPDDDGPMKPFKKAFKKDPTRDRVAQWLAEVCNGGALVPAGYIPLTTPNIAYNQPDGDVSVRPTVGLTALLQNAPNPVRQAGTDIRFRLATPGQVRLDVFDLQGRLIANLADGNAVEGETLVHWDGKARTGVPLAHGIYFYRLETADGVFTQKLILAN